MRNYETIADAVLVAKEICAGIIDPFIGCGLVSTISKGNNSPGLLFVFELLAHEQHGHEQLGITSETTLPRIKEACEVLLTSKV